MFSPDSKVARDLSILSHNLKLKDMGFKYLHAERSETQEQEPPAFHLGVSFRPEAETPDDEPLMARIAMRVEVVLPEGRISAEPYAEFTLDRQYGEALNHSGLTAYANDRVIFDLLPFAREALSDLSSRVFKSQLLMPHFDREELQFPLPDTDDESKESD